MKKLLLAMVAMTWCTVSFAETGSAARLGDQAGASQGRRYATQSAAEIAPATSICSFTFTAGTGLSFLKYCVTANGNITQFETPEFVEHIAAGDVAEGYGVCDLTDNNNNVAYFDYADGGDSRNWGPTTVLSQTAKAIKMVRTTGDGVWTLTQAFNLMAGNAPSVQITMTLKNNTDVDRSAGLIRFADADVAAIFNNNFDATVNTAFAWNLAGTSDSAGLALQTIGNPPSGLYVGLVQNDPNPPATCDPFARAVEGPLTATDGSIMAAHFVNVPKNSSKTITVAYKGF